MRILIFTLWLCAAPLAYGQSCDGVPQKLGALLGAASKAASLGAQMPSGYGAAPAKLGKPLQGARAVALGSELACECAGASDTMQCLQENIDKEFICAAYGASGLPDFTNPFSVLAVSFPPIGVPAALGYDMYYGDSSNPFCDDPGTGGLNLVCCKYNPDQQFCHTGFAGEDAVNCLGAPSPNQPQQFGKVQFPGVGCAHIPECVPGGVADQSSHSVGDRTADWFNDLSAAYAGAAYGPNPSQCNADFATFVGCKDWFEVARNGQPYLALHDSPAAPAGAAADELQQDLFSFAAQRVMYAIPNGLARHQHIASRVWSDADKASYLGNVDASVELNKWMSPCGIELLQASMPDTWQLMTVPAPEEGPLDKDEALNWQDACLVGQPPSDIDVTLSVHNAQATLTVAVDDPEADPDDPDINPFSVAWGDGAITGEIFNHADAINAFTHRYAGPGTYQASMSYINDAGLARTEVISITVP